MLRYIIELGFPGGLAVQAEYTIDELARVADTTVRSVRVYHERGLIPSPKVRGRIGYYGAEHLNRLHTISRLLSRGMKLNGIRELLDAWDRGDGLADVLGVTNAPATSPTETLPAIPEATGAADALAAYQVTDPRCADLAGRLVAVGLEPAAASAMAEQLRLDCHRIADRYAPELLYCLAARPCERSEHTEVDRPRFDTDTAGALRAVTHAISELILEGFARRADIASGPGGLRPSA